MPPRRVECLAVADPRRETALRGERLAEAFLKKRGLKSIARRFNTPVGELDLVMRDGRTLVFVEVKTRSDRVFADPQDALNPAKWRRLTRAAQWFIKHRGCEDDPCRFDVVGVTLPESGDPQIEHFPDAFVPDVG